MDYAIAFITPGGSVGQCSPAGALIFVMLIGFMAAMAIPAFQKVRETSLAMACKNQQAMLAAALDQFALENRKGASSWDDIVGHNKYIATMPICPSGGEYSADKQAGSYVVTCSHEAHNQPVRGPAKSRRP